MSAHEQALETGFFFSSLVHVPNASALAVAKDGRVYIASRTGTVHLVKPGAMVTTPTLQLPAAQLCADTTRGLLGFALDPEFPAQPHAYVFYTRNRSATCAVTDPATRPAHRVSRFSIGANGNFDLTTEKVLLDGISAPATGNPGGGLVFGTDGFLYVAVGDGQCSIDGAGRCDTANDNARTVDTLLGKLLRVTRDGAPAPGNPFASAPGARACADPMGAPSGVGPCAEIFASGLRNPTHFAFGPQTQELFINDVALPDWSEINLGTAGADYGWNARQGACPAGVDAGCAPAAPGFTDPLYAYPRKTACDDIGGGAFVPAKTFPAHYDHAYLFSGCGQVRYLSRAPDGGMEIPHKLLFGLSGGQRFFAFGPSLHPEGAKRALYFIDTQEGFLRKLHYRGVVNQAPVASLEMSPETSPAPLTVTLDGTGSTDADGDALVYQWDFGDGSPVLETSTPTVTHRYPRGTFTATLTVRDTDDTLSVPVTATFVGTNAAPSANLTASPVSAPYPSTVVLDGSGSADPNADALTYLWDPGDGSPAIETASATLAHTYGQGRFTASLQVRDEHGALSASTATVEVNAFNVAPTAVLATPAPAPAPALVLFDATGSSDANGDGLTYEWNFGDGSPTLVTSGPLASHTYAAGSYVAELRVRDSNGVVSEPQSVPVLSLNDAPVAALQATTATSGMAPLAMTLDASAATDVNGDVLTYLWDFGDGSEPLELDAPEVTHTFGVGTFTVTLRVRDPHGALSEPVTLDVEGFNAAPVSSLEARPASGTAPLVVTLDAALSHDPNGELLTFLWDFGDGSPALETRDPFVEHTYGIGAFTARVTVRDPHGATSAPSTVSVGAVNARPRSSLVVSTTSGAAPLTVTLDASTTVDPNGDALEFHWSFGDGTPDVTTTNPVISHVYGPGTFTLTLLVTDVHGAESAPAMATIDAFNSAPMARIVSADPEPTFAVGETLLFEAEALDAQDGTLEGSALRWSVWMHHDGHVHAVAEGQGTRLSFVAPAPESLEAQASSQLEVRLVATDGQGESATVTLPVRPRLSTLRFDSQPSGLTLSVGGQLLTTPAQLTSWEGFTFDVVALDQSDAQGQFWSFASWSNDGSATHAFTTPDDDTTLIASFATTGRGTGLSVTYFDHPDFSGKSVSRVDPQVAFDWELGSPAPGIDVDTFSARWVGSLQATTSGLYTLYTTTDDGVRLWVNGQLVIDNWTTHAATTDRALVTLTAGQHVDLRMEYFENGVYAVAKLEWSGPGVPRQLIPTTQLYPAPPSAYRGQKLAALGESK